MRTYYILDDKTPVPCSSEEWSKWFATADRIEAKTEVGSAHVSTVFLGFDHRHFGEGPPLVFETMIFGGPYDGFQSRASTWDESLKKHAFAMGLARASQN